LAGKQLDQVETLVLLAWHGRDAALPDESLPELLELFPNLKCLRLRVNVLADPEALGRTVATNFERLSELVVEQTSNLDHSDLGVCAVEISCGLGSGWTRAPVAPGYRKQSLRFVAQGRDRASFSCYFFEQKFFTHDYQRARSSVGV
jgi:hypothetical protein